MKMSEEIVNEHYSVSNYPKLDIAGIKPKGTSCDTYRMNDYIVDYNFSDSFKLNGGKRMNNDKRTRYERVSYFKGCYLLANSLNNTLKNSDIYYEPNGIVLSIDYIEFLQFLKRTNITLKTTYNRRDGIQYNFLSYPSYIESESVEYLLNKLFILGLNKEISGIGTLIETPNKYHMGKNVFREYDSYLDKNDGRKVSHVRMLMNDNNYHWVRIAPIKWNVNKEINQLFTDSIIIPYDYPFEKDAEKCVAYINKVLFQEMNYHPDLYISDSIWDKICISYQLHRYRNYLLSYCRDDEFADKPKSRVLKK